MKNYPWNTNEEFYDLHAHIFFKKDKFYQVGMLSEVDEENANYIINKLNLKPSDSVVDLGCGSGYMTHKISEICSCIGISNSKECVNQAKKNYPKNNFEVANMETFSLKDATHFISLESISYSNQEKTFKNAYNSLVDDGIFFIKEISLISNPDKEEQENIDYWNHYWKYYPLTVDRMISLAYKCGFKLINFIDVSNDENLKINPFLNTLKDNILPQIYPYPEKIINVLTEFVFQKMKR